MTGDRRARATERATESEAGHRVPHPPDRALSAGLAVVRHLGNAAVTAALTGAVPDQVRSVLREPGAPDTVRPTPAADVDHEVRVHTGDRADRSARQLGALAYTWGNHVVLADWARHDPDVLRHELVHVRQQAGRAQGDPPRVLPAASVAEQRATTGDPAPAELGVALLRDPRLDTLLARIPPLATSAWVDDPNRSLRALGKLVEEIAVDLTDPDNLTPFAAAVSRHFPPVVLAEVLKQADTLIAERADRAAGQQRAAQVEEMMRPERRGPYGNRVPGTPLFSAARTVPGAETLAHGVDSASAFLRGVQRGFGQGGDPKIVAKLEAKLAESARPWVVLPVFAAGTVVGIGRDLLNALEAVVHLPDTIRQLLELANVVFSPDGADVLGDVGVSVGESYRADLARLVGLSSASFVFEVGKLIGPSLVAVILSFYGVGLADLATQAIGRVATTLRRSAPLIKAVERLRPYVTQVAASAARLWRDERGAIRLDLGFAGKEAAAVEVELSKTTRPVATGGKQPRIDGTRVPTRQPRRLDLQGIARGGSETARDAVARVRRVIGRRISDTPLAPLWKAAREKVLGSRSLEGASRQEMFDLYNKVRNEFWDSLRSEKNATAKEFLEKSGFELTSARAPLLKVNDPSLPVQERRISLDHNLEKALGENYKRAIDADNLTFEFHNANSNRETVQVKFGLRATPDSGD